MSNLVISNTSLNNAANSGSTNGDSSMADLLTNSVNQFSSQKFTIKFLEMVTLKGLTSP